MCEKSKTWQVCIYKENKGGQYRFIAILSEKLKVSRWWPPHYLPVIDKHNIKYDFLMKS